MRQNEFVLAKKQSQQLVGVVKAIPREFHQSLVVADIDKKRIRKVVRKTYIM